MSGLIGRKVGMTSIFDENGKNVPCTVIEAGPCVVTQVRTEEVDGYQALQLGFDDKAEKRANKAENGHFKKAGTAPKKKVVEFRGFNGEHKLGDVIGVIVLAVWVRVRTVSTTDYVLQDLSEQHRIQPEFLKVCVWPDRWVMSG